MQDAHVTPRLFDSEVINASEKRLRTLLKANYSKFRFITSFEQKLSEAEHEQQKAQGKSGKRVLPATKTIVAAVLGCELFRDLPRLAIPVDEHLGSAELCQRRQQQASMLSAFLLKKSTALGLILPSSLDLHCRDFIDMWQPTTRTYDELAQTIHRASEAKNAGKLPEWFIRLSPQLEDASWGSEILPKALVYEALALLKVGDEASLTPNIWNRLAWLLMRENLGIAAINLANSEEFSKTSRAANILEIVWESGVIYAGVQLARMYQHVLAPNRLSLQRAEEVIDKVLKQYKESPNRMAIFTTAKSHAELFQTYNIVKIDALREAEDPHKVFQLTMQILAACTDAARLGFEGFAACALSILAPELPELQGEGNEELFALRKKISRYPQAEAFCQALAESVLPSRRQASYR